MRKFIRSVYGFSADFVCYTAGRLTPAPQDTGLAESLPGGAQWISALGLGAAGIRERRGGHVTGDRRQSSEMEATQCSRSLNREWKRKDTSKGPGRLPLGNRHQRGTRHLQPIPTGRCHSPLLFCRGQPERQRLRDSPSAGLDRLLVPLPRGAPWLCPRRCLPSAQAPDKLRRRRGTGLPANNTQRDLINSD